MNRARGFTLLETLVAVAIFSIVILLVVIILRGGQEQARLNDAKMLLQEAARESLYRMGLEIRETSPSRLSITSAGTVLTFQIPASVDNSGNITWSNPVIYMVGGNGSQLVRIDTTTGAWTVLANYIQSVAFQASGSFPATLTFSVTAQRTLMDGRVLSVTSTGEAKLRNY